MSAVRTPDLAVLDSPRRCARVLVVADERGQEGAERALLDAVDLASARIDVVTVPHIPASVLLFAPLSGLTTPAQVREEACERARRTACAIVSRIGPGASYRVITGWGAIGSLVGDGTHDVVVLGCRPRTRAGLRRLVKAAAETGAALVVGRG